MNWVQYLVSLVPLLLNVVLGVQGRRECFTDVGCFDSQHIFELGVKVPDTPEDVGTQFQLFTRRTREENPTILNYLDNSTLRTFDGSKIKTFFIVHGLTQNAKSPSMVLLRKAILSKLGDVNVIMVDWRNGSQYIVNFLRSDVNSLLVGRQIARLVQLLSIRKNLDVKHVHLIGLSSGAQANGFAGKWFKNITGDTIGRISGLDASGVWFQLQTSDYYLSKTDADFVDLIHTSSGKVPVIGDFGILTPTGHVDFYPNGGRFQRQCSEQKNIVQALICSHEASVKYFAESITKDAPFTSNPCPGIASQLSTEIYWRTQCNGPCGKKCGRMGYYSDLAPGRGPQYLTTNFESPFCKG